MSAWQRLGAVALVAGLFLAVACFGAPKSAVAAESSAPVGSLELVPADAAFYWAKLRGREEIQLIAKSRAWAKLMEMPVLEMALAFYNLQAADPNSPAGKFRAAMADPEVLKSLELVGDMFSTEFFLFGDKSCAELVQLLQEINGMNRSNSMKLLTNELGDQNPETMQQKMLLNLIVKYIDRIKTPEMVAGFKVSNKALAQQELKKLEGLVSQALKENPDFKGKFKRQQVGKDEFLTLTFDGSMIPFDEMPEKIKEYEENEGDVDKLIEQIKKRTCTIAVGLHGEYLLATVGPSTEFIERLGKGKTLAQSAELKPLAKFADKRLTSVSYLSKDMAQSIVTTDKDIDGLVDLARGALGALVKEEKLTEDQSDRIEKDAVALAADIKKKLPKADKIFGFSFLVEKGVESYTYTGMKHPDLDGSKQLSLLEHLGGDPMMAIVMRNKKSLADYETAVKWIKTGYGYFEELAVPEMNDEERENFEQIMKVLKPACMRMDKANRELLLPATADGQCAFVLDARLKGKKFHEAMPESSSPLPLPQPAIVCGLSDRAKFIAGLAEYREAINAVLDGCRKIEDSEIPEWLSIPEAEKTETKAGDLFAMPLPKDWGLDKRLVVMLGVSDKTAVFAMSKGHTERLLSPKTLKSGGVFGEGKDNRPRGVVAVVDFAAIVGTIRPWIDYAFEQAGGEEPGMAVAAAQAQVQTVLDVLTVFRTLTSESYLEGETVVTHSLFEIADVPE